MTISKNDTYGLILTGGKSSRMGKDKGTLNYHGRTQVDHSYEMLSSVCDRVFLSCRQDQVELPHLSQFKKIVDKYEINGPINGILSALKEHPDKYWLVLAIDLPFLTESVIEKLVSSADPNAIATCYENPEKKWPEPLCTVYTPKAISAIEKYLARDKKCPRKLLTESDVKIIKIENVDPLRNINTTEEFQQASMELSKEKR